MKENIMRDKIISFTLGILVGGVLVYSYSYFIGDKSKEVLGGGNPGTRQMGNFDASSMSDEQLERMATRAGITTDELKDKLEAGESLRDIMPQRTGSGAGIEGRRNQNTLTGTGSN